jgi:ATP-dependent protease ClpP protease subunit
MKSALKKLATLAVGLALSSAAFSDDTVTSTAATTEVQPIAVLENPKDGKLILTKDNMVVLNDVFDEKTTAQVATLAKDMDGRLPSGEPIFLVLDTPGGQIDAGLQMIEVLSNLNRPVHTLTIFSASMGFQAVQGLGERYILKNGTLMAHKARGGFRGEFPGQIDSRYQYYLKRVFRMDEQTVKRTNGKHTLRSFHALMENEFWCDGEDCIAQGLADKVVGASCDKSLDGATWKVVDKFIFMGRTIELKIKQANCPLITGFLDFNVTVDNRDLYSTDEDGNRRYSTPLLSMVSMETAENIRKIIEEKVSDFSQKKVIKY